MTTDTQTIDTPTEGRTPGEEAYFKSGGANTDALGKEFEAEIAKANGTTAPTQTTNGADGQEQTNGKATEGDDDDPGAITLDSEGKARDARGRFVPESAFLRVKKQAKEFKTRAESVAEENRSLMEKRALLDGRMQTLLEIINTDAEPGAVNGKAQPTAPQKPDPETDIFGYVKWLESQIEATKSETGKAVKQTAEQLEQQNVTRTYEQDVQRVLASKPDYQDAFQHLALTRARELVVLGFVDDSGKPDTAAIQKQLAEEARQIIAQAVKAKRSPAETVYALATAKGYQIKAKEQAKTDGKASAAQQIETIKQAMTTGKSLSDAGGSATESLTLEALAGMPDDEFAKVSAKVRKRLLGG